MSAWTDTFVRWLRCALILSAGLIFAGCASREPKAQWVKAQIVASTDANPSREGQASPVHARIYQLKDARAFLAADYWALVDAEQQTLGSAVLDRIETDVGPGEKRTFKLEIAPEAKVLAVVVEFANYRNAQWRAVKQRPNKSLFDIFKSDRISVEISKDRTAIRVAD